MERLVLDGLGIAVACMAFVFMLCLTGMLVGMMALECRRFWREWNARVDEP